MGDAVVAGWKIALSRFSLAAAMRRGAHHTPFGAPSD